MMRGVPSMATAYSISATVFVNGEVTRDPATNNRLCRYRRHIQVRCENRRNSGSAYGFCPRTSVRVRVESWRLVFACDIALVAFNQALSEASGDSTFFGFGGAELLGPSAPTNV